LAERVPLYQDPEPFAKSPRTPALEGLSKKRKSNNVIEKKKKKQYRNKKKKQRYRKTKGKKT